MIEQDECARRERRRLETQRRLIQSVESLAMLMSTSSPNPAAPGGDDGGDVRMTAMDWICAMDDTLASLPQVGVQLVLGCWLLLRVGRCLLPPPPPHPPTLCRSLHLTPTCAFSASHPPPVCFSFPCSCLSPSCISPSVLLLVPVCPARPRLPRCRTGPCLRPAASCLSCARK